MFQQVKDAYDRIADHVNHTPVMTSSTLNNRFSSRFYFKCENFQKIGAFKFRGALNAVAQLSLEEKKRGVITHSSGNHAQALALAGKILDVKTVIVMPENAPAVKVEATKGYGAEVIMCGSKPGDREEAVKPLIKKHGYVLVHPSNDWEIIYGQGTAAFELIKEVGNLDYLLAPVGGGGLLSGTAIVAKGLLENVKVIGVEPKNADDAYKSFTRGKIHPSLNPNTIADGLRTQLGSNTFKVIQEKVDKIITVSEEQIVDAMQFIWERMKIIVEPSGAVPLAGIFSEQLPIKDTKCGIILSGGNIDLTNFFNRLRNTINNE